MLGCVTETCLADNLYIIDFLCVFNDKRECYKLIFIQVDTILFEPIGGSIYVKQIVIVIMFSMTVYS